MSLEAEDAWEALPRVAHRVAAFAEIASALRPHCDSPIEVTLGATLKHLIAQRYVEIEVRPQFQLRRFRYDFAMVTPGICAPPRVLIECDGAEFHSTPAQLANDRRKDAAAVEIGAAMLRFTGREIVRDPHGCALVALTEFLRRGSP